MTTPDSHRTPDQPGATGAVAPSGQPDEAVVERLRTRIGALMPQALEELAALARIRSISALPEYAGQLAASAGEVARLLRAQGADARVVTAGGAPAVIGKVAARRGEGATGDPVRVLLYAHHDVQPPGDEDAWASPPFEPEQRGGRMYGRGVADDKAGVLAHLTALRAFDGEPPVEVIVFVEGEEESGSPSLPALLEQYRDELDCDVIVLADSANWAVGTPALTTSLRGNVVLILELATLSHGLHSGMFGGVVPDAVTAMCRLLATLHHDDGSVAVAGLTGSVTSSADYAEEQIRADAQTLPGVQLIGRGTIASRLWHQSAITVIGFEAPGVAGAANLLTPRCRAVISVRTDPRQDAGQAAAALRAHLEAHVPWGASLSIEVASQAPGSALPSEGPVPDAARQAMRQAWGTDPVDAGIGGSIPFIAQFQEAFPDAVVLVTGVEDPDTRAHGTDESLHLAEFERACLAEALLLEHLGRR